MTSTDLLSGLSAGRSASYINAVLSEKVREKEEDRRKRK